MSAPIIQKIQEVKEICRVAKQSSEVTNAVDNFKSYLEILQSTVKHQFLILMQRYSVLSRISDVIGNEKLQKTLNLFRDDIQFLKEKLKNNNITQNDFFAFNRNNNDLDEALKSAWSSYVKAKLDGIYSTLYIFHDLIGDDKFEQLKNQYAYLKNTKATDAFVRQIDDFAKEGNSIIDKMNADTKVKEFIVKMSNGTATLNDLTSEVYNWFKGHDYLNRVKIIL